MNTIPTQEQLRITLDAAWDVHREFQRVYLKGVRDEAWPGWYAAYVLGRHGDFMTASLLATLLEAAPEETEDWSKTAAQYVLKEIGA